MARQPSEQARVAVLLEEMRDQIRVVLEGHSVLNAKIDRLEQRMDQRFAVVETALLELSRDTRRRFEQVDQRFQQVDQRFQQMDGRLEAIDHRLIVHEQLHTN